LHTQETKQNLCQYTPILMATTKITTKMINELKLYKYYID